MWERRFVLAPLADLAPDLVSTRPRSTRPAGRSGSLGLARQGVVTPRPHHRARPGRGRRWPRRWPTRAGQVLPSLGRGDDVGGAADDVDLVVIATPDATVAEVAAAVRPRAEAVVAHLSGSLGLGPLAGPPSHARWSTRSWRCPTRRAAPPGCTARGSASSADGDPLGADVVAVLEGRAVTSPSRTGPATTPPR